MVFVPVSDKEALDLILIFNQVVIILDDIINPQQIIFWEEDPTVNNDDFVLELDTVHVLPDFAKAPDCVKGHFVIFDI